MWFAFCSLLIYKIYVFQENGYIYRPGTEVQVLFIFMDLSILLNSCTNCLVYSFASKKFRRRLFHPLENHVSSKDNGRINKDEICDNEEIKRNIEMKEI